MPVRGGNHGRQKGNRGKHGLSADDAADVVPPVVEVGLRNDGVELSDGVGSCIDGPRERVVKIGDEMSDVPPDSSEDDINGTVMSEVVSSQLKDMVIWSSNKT